ncbi:Protein sof1 [Glugoides intestinalis]
MKIESICHSKSERRKECKGDRTEKKFSKEAVHHPMILEREYVRALNAVKIERMFAKPFITALTHHSEGINKLTKNNDSTMFISSSYDNKVVLWDLYTRKIVKEMQFPSIINGIAVDKSNNTFISQNKSVFLNAESFFELDSVVSSIDLTENLCVGTASGISIFDLNRLTPKISYLAEGINTVKFNRSFKHIVCGINSLSLKMFDNRTSKEFLDIAIPGTNCMAFNPQKGFMLACGNENGDGYLYDIRNSEKAVETFRAHTNAVVSLAFSPNGQEIATGSFDKTIRIFKTNERKPRDCYYNDRMQIVHAVEYSNDGEFVISGSDDGSLRIWKAHASKKVDPMTKIEKESSQYKEALKEKFKAVGEIARISKHRFMNKEIKNEMRIKNEMYEGSKRRALKRQKEFELRKNKFMKE